LLGVLVRGTFNGQPHLALFKKKKSHAISLKKVETKKLKESNFMNVSFRFGD